MLENQLKKTFAAGQPALNGWLSIGNSYTAEIMAAQGYDCISIDIQHGVLDMSDIVPMFQAMRASGVVPMARVPWLDPAAIMKVLDSGALGIICPMVNTPQQAAEFISYMYYPPLGERSFGPARSFLGHGADYYVNANAQTLAWAMVETAEAMSNLDAIAATKGLSGIYVGPSDLSISLSDGKLAPGFDRQEPEIVAALKKIIAACKNAGILCALHCGTPAYAKQAIDWGFDMVTVAGDSVFLAKGAAQSVNEFRSLTNDVETNDVESDSQQDGGY